MKTRIFLGIGVGLILGLSGTAQAQLSPSWWTTAVTGAGIEKADKDMRQLEHKLAIPPAPALGTNAVSILNPNTQKTVTFSLIGDSCSRPLYASLAPSSSDTFTCSDANAFQLRVDTPRGDGSFVTRRYNLRPSAQYWFDLDKNDATWHLYLRK